MPNADMAVEFAAVAAKQKLLITQSMAMKPFVGAVFLPAFMDKHPQAFQIVFFGIIMRRMGIRFTDVAQIVSRIATFRTAGPVLEILILSHIFAIFP
jgi:hypothetical protein